MTQPVDLFQSQFYKHVALSGANHMKIFISWSGDRSLLVAKALREWLPRVIQAVQPWLSETDIGKGSRWEKEIGSQLEDTRFGIICLTRGNLDARWINFEAGALSKSIEKSFVCTYLLELKPTDIEGPLSQFNHTRVDADDTRKLIHTINRALESRALEESIVNDAFDLWWPRLEERLNRLKTMVVSDTQIRTDRDLLEEILSLIRNQELKRNARADEADKIALRYFDWMKSILSLSPNPDVIQLNALDAIMTQLRRQTGRKTHWGNKLEDYIQDHHRPRSQSDANEESDELNRSQDKVEEAKP